MEQLTITQEGYIEIKSKIKDKLNETVNNFIVIGYYLKQIRDSGAYINDGYHSIEDFAQGEYHLSKSTADRFMDINTMFSVDGNSLEIKEQYRLYGYSKLQEMLTMKPEDFELISEDTPVKQMRAIKALEREEDTAIKQQEEAELPLIVMSDSQDHEEDVEEKEEEVRELTPLEEITIAFWKEQNDDFKLVLANDMLTDNIAAEEISPNGSRIFSGRLAMLFFYSLNVGIKHRYILDKKPKIDQLTYTDFIDVSKRLYLEGLIDNTEEDDNDNIQSDNKNCATSQEDESPKKKWEEPVIIRQSSDEENAPYEPIEGQTTVEDINIMPDNVPEKVKGEVVIDEKPTNPKLIIKRLESKIEALTEEYNRECAGADREWYRVEDILKILKEIRG